MKCKFGVRCITRKNSRTINIIKTCMHATAKLFIDSLCNAVRHGPNTQFHLRLLCLRAVSESSLPRPRIDFMAKTSTVCHAIPAIVIKNNPAPIPKPCNIVLLSTQNKMHCLIPSSQSVAGVVLFHQGIKGTRKLFLPSHQNKQVLFVFEAPRMVHSIVS